MGHQATASLLTARPASRATPGILLSRGTAPLSKDTASLSKGTAPLSKDTASLSKGTASRPLPELPDKHWVRLPAKRSAVGSLVQPWAVPSARLPAAVLQRHPTVHPPSRVTAATSNPASVRPRSQVTVLTRRDSLRI